MPTPSTTIVGHVGLQAYAERRHHVGPLNAGTHDAAERGLVQQKPDADEHKRHDAQQQEAIAREQEVADDDRALQACGMVCGSGGAPQMMRIACSATIASPKVTSRLRIGSAA